VTRRLREHGLALVFAGVGVWTMVYLGLYGFAWTDYDFEVTPAYNELTAGHVWAFFQHAPGYGGSLELRAPFALLPGLWGGGQFAVYQVVALPCLIAAALLGVWLCARMRALGSSTLARATALTLCVANPITMEACIIGHPEELLGAVLCIAAVLLAQRSRYVWAGLLLGIAIVNKEWALLAIGPVLIALPARRWRTLMLAGAIAVVFYAPLIIAQLTTRATGGALTIAHTATIFQPWQVWWFLGSHGHLVSGPSGIHAGYRTPPAWLSDLSHPLIIALGLPLTLLALRSGRRRRGGADALLLLTVLLLARCVLDPWDNVYYPLPFIITLLVWESLTFRRPPLFTLIATAATWAIFEAVPNYANADIQSAVFLIVALPALAALSLALFRPALPALRSGARPLLGRATRQPAISSSAQ
jgi:hypothetical protein